MASKQLSPNPGGVADPGSGTASLERLRGANVLVTGGAGFIGSHLTDQLIDAGVDSVVVLDNLVRGRISNLHPALKSNRVRLLTGDIRDRRLLDESVQGMDYVFHMAALRITHCAAEPRLAMEVMVDATYDLFEACRSAGVKKIVYSSSASVYGMADSFPTTEDHHPYANRTLYGAAKSFGESLLRSLNDMYGTNYIGLRYFNVYGPRMDIHGKYTEVLSRWMERLEDGQPPIIFGDGSQTMDMVHVRDIARANVLASVADASDIALNVGSGTETSLLDLAHTLARIMDRGDLQPVFQEARSVNPVARRLADVSLAKKAIGFESQISFEAGLRELVEWWRVERTRPESSRAVG